MSEGDDLGARVAELTHFNSELIRQRAALEQRLAEVEAALRLHLAIGPDDPVLVEPAEKQVIVLRTRLAEVERERDEAICECGKNSGFWGRACARLIDQRDALQREVQELKASAVTHVSESVSLTLQLEKAKRETTRLRELVQDILDSGVSFEDERIHYKEVQIARSWFDDAQQALAARQGEE